MTLTTRTVPILALAAALAVPATAVAQDGARDRARLEAERAQLQRDLQRLDRELARDAQTHAQELARATGEIVRGLAIEAGMLAGRFAGDVVEDVVRDMSADGRFFAQRGVPGLRGDGPEVTDTVSRTVTLGDAGTFELTNLAGDITITATGGDQAVVEAVKRVRNRDEAQGRAQLDALEVEFTEQPGRLEVSTDFPNDRRLSAEVEFTVRVPAGTRVRVRTVSGGIQLTGIQGEVRAESISGNVTVSDASRIDLLKTVSGTLSLTDAELENGTVSAVSGDVVLSDVRGRSLDAQAVSGRRARDRRVGERRPRVRGPAAPQRPVRAQPPLGADPDGGRGRHRVRPQREHVLGQRGVGLPARAAGTPRPRPRPVGARLVRRRLRRARPPLLQRHHQPGRAIGGRGSRL